MAGLGPLVRRSFGPVRAHSCGTLLIAGGFDRFVEAVMPALLRRDDGRAVIAAGAVLPDAHGRLFRGDRQRARHYLAVFGLAVAARFSAAGEPGEGSRSFLAVEDARAASS